MLLQESVAEALRQASIEMKDAKYLKADNDDGKDDAEADADTDLFKKRTSGTRAVSWPTVKGSSLAQALSGKGKECRDQIVTACD